MILRGLSAAQMILVLWEVRPGGSQADGVGYSDCKWGAATSSRLRAGSRVVFDGSCAALDEAPPVEPPERTSGTDERNSAGTAEAAAASGGRSLSQWRQLGPNRAAVPRSEMAGTSSGPLSWQLGPTPEDGFQVRAGGLLIGLSFLAYGVEAVSHYEKWRSLGSPELFRNTSRGYGSFIRSSEYRALGDENLNRLVRKYKNQIKVLLLIGSIFAILVLAELRWLD